MKARSGETSRVMQISITIVVRGPYPVDISVLFLVVVVVHFKVANILLLTPSATFLPGGITLPCDWTGGAVLLSSWERSTGK
ncbi:MAG: hypothetical protein KKF41_02350 [Actinobacteria bacterium]|nr:hypothetical protein [Actinomycetota bacterium]MBU1945141.1 hypothetical protein [Actinomycetota bacterium]MBU2686409.1 hypothetical protein [Actinomycetota bacterium]